MDNLVAHVAIALCDALGSSTAAAVKRAIVDRKWGDLVATTVHPSDYSNAEDYLRNAAASEFLRKCGGLETGVDLHQVAVDNFFASETVCHASNQRISRYVAWFTDGFVGDQTDLRLYEYIYRVRERIRAILGPIPKSLDLRLGKGATYYDRGDEITIPHKFSSQPCRTAACWWADFYVYQSAWGMAALRDTTSSAPLIVKGNRFTSVPKDSAKNRGICIEPAVNLSLQLPIGAHLKMRLMQYAGIDLVDGQEEHRRLARLASVDGSLATIDLSNASDTISYNLVKLLLPGSWFDLLSDLRSPFTEIENKWVRLEKFSSMGNGFTFELETLIFYALARECGGQTHKVYGDDIIVDTEVAKTVLASLALFGFTPNRKKTFIEGPFRESCGGDYFSGVDVRPFYLKEFPRAPNEWISLANGLRRLGRTDVQSGAWRLGLLRPWLRALDAIPSDIRRLRGPRSLGDIVIHDDPERWTTRSYGRDGYRQWVRTWQPQRRVIPLTKFRANVQFAAALYGVPSTGPSPRGEAGIRGYRKRWLPLLERTET